MNYQQVKKKLKNELIKDIVKLNKSGWGYGTVKALAEKYGYSRANIYKIRRQVDEGNFD
jgi:DNA invertase Pin-like site-specific DNA recombinase